jgi:hypothetical protein
MTWPRRAPLTAGVVAIAVGILAIVVFLVEGRAPGPSSASRAETAVVREGRFRDVVVLDGSIAAPPETPLTLTNPASELEWAVPNGGAVRRGEVLFVESAPLAAPPLDSLQGRFTAAAERVTSARMAARRAATAARRTVRHAATTEERADAKAELRRVVAGSAQRISAALQEQAQLVAEASAAPQTRTVVHRAPTDGIVHRARGAGSAEGLVGTLKGADYSVWAALDPLLMYRFHGSPSDATVSIPGGPPRFRCRHVDVHFRSDESAALTAETPQPPAASAATPAATLTCVVPRDVRVFAGLRAIVRLTASTLHHSLMVPASAVRPGGASRGMVTLLRAGRWVERDVALGPSDGATVVVKKGLNPGQTVLLDAGSRPPTP